MMRFSKRMNVLKAVLPLFMVGALCACSDDDNTSSANPTDPTDPIVGQGTPVVNPYLASELYSLTHFNSAQTDAFPYAVKWGTYYVDTTSYKMNWSGPVNLMTLSSTNKDYMWGMCSDRVSYIHIADGDYTRVAEAELPNIRKNSAETLQKLVDTQYESTEALYADVVKSLGVIPQLSMANGNYVICDKDNYAYTNARTVICRYKLKDANNPAARADALKNVTH